MWNRIGRVRARSGAEKAAELEISSVSAEMVGENPNPSGTASVVSIGGLAVNAVHNPLRALVTLVGCPGAVPFPRPAQRDRSCEQGLTIDASTDTGRAAALQLLREGEGLTNRGR